MIETRATQAYYTDRPVLITKQRNNYSIYLKIPATSWHQTLPSSWPAPARQSQPTIRDWWGSSSITNRRDLRGSSFNLIRNIYEYFIPQWKKFHRKFSISSDIVLCIFIISLSVCIQNFKSRHLHIIPMFSQWNNEYCITVGKQKFSLAVI